MSELLDEPDGYENESEEDETMAPSDDEGYGGDEGDGEESLPPE